MAAVLVVGSLNADMVVSVERPPRPGETVLANGLADAPGGKGANQAVAAAWAGAASAMAGRIGADAAGSAQLAALTAAGVDATSVLVDTEARSGLALVLVDATGENSIVVVPGANARLSPDDAAAALAAHPDADVVVTQTEIPVPAVDRLAAQCVRQGRRFVLNCAPAAPVAAATLRAADPLVVNEQEAQSLSGTGLGASPAAALREACGARSVVVTLGGSGAAYADADTAGRVPARAVDVVDTTGAGDWFVGALAAALADGLPLAEATRRAVTAASHCVTWHGARPRSSGPGDGG